MIEATLVAKTRSGVLTVRSTTPNALVAVDGKIIGNAPTEAPSPRNGGSGPA
jgi:hypothetical protein